MGTIFPGRLGRSGRRWSRGVLRLGEIDLDGLEDARAVEALAGFVPVGLEHELQSRAEIFAALGERTAVGERAGNLLDPSHEASVLIGLDDRVIALLHNGYFGPA